MRALSDIAIVFFIHLALWLGATQLSRAATLAYASPAFAPANASVIVHGSGFNPAGSYTLLLNGTTVTLGTIQTNQLSFTVPANASSGFLELIPAGEPTIRLFQPFIVTRDINVVISNDLAGSVSLTGYKVGSVYGDSAQTAPPFSVKVAVGEPTLVIVAHSDADPTYAAFVTDEQTQVVISPISTLQTIDFLLPTIFTADSTNAQARLNALAQIPEMGLAAARLLQLAHVGQDFINDAQIGSWLHIAADKWADAYLAAHPAILAGAVAAGAGADSEHKSSRAKAVASDYVDNVYNFASDYPRDLLVPGFEPLNRLSVRPVAAIDEESDIPQLGMRYVARPFTSYGPVEIGGNPMDWLAVSYELDHLAFGSKSTVNALQGSHTAIYSRNKAAPLGRKVIASTAIGDNLKITDQMRNLLYNYVIKHVSPIELIPKPEPDLQLDADGPGLYEVRLFSGSRFNPQANLIKNLPGAASIDGQMVTHNLIMAVIDASVVPIKIFNTFAGEGEEAERLEQFMEILQTVAATVQREQTQGTLDGRMIEVIFKAGAEKLAETAIKELASKPLQVLPHCLQLLIKAVELSIDTAQPINRLMALSNVVNYVFPTAYVGQAAQTSLAMVGDPFVPYITSFEPQLGYRGTLVLINGANFSTTPAENLVRFGGSVTNPEDPNAGVVAQIVSATASSLLVRVPVGAPDGFNAISIAVSGRGATSIANLKQPYNKFKIIPDPVIVSIIPDPPTAKGTMTITGLNFHPTPTHNQVNFASGGLPEIVAGTTTTLTVRVPDTIDPNTVRITIDGRQSNSFLFTAMLGAIDNQNQGLILITSTADNNVADGDITLREAMLLARGSLGRQLTVRPDNDGSPNPFESDFVSGIGQGDTGAFPGASTSDIINADFNLPAASVFMLTSPLPQIANQDWYQLHAYVLDGSAMPPDSDGLVLNNASQCVIQGVTLSHIKRHGIVLTGNCASNTIGGHPKISSAFQVIIDDCGGDGVRLEGQATGNVLSYITATHCNNGLHLTGPGARANRYIRSPQIFPGQTTQSFDDNTQYGLLIDGGASENTIECPLLRRNGLGGARITGATSRFNFLGTSTEGGRRSKVFDNLGPGIGVDAPGTVLRRMNIGGNQGDGIVIENGVSDVLVDSMRIGYDDDIKTTPTTHPNTGSGIHIRPGSHNIWVGRAQGTPLTGDARNYIGGNLQHGVFIEGPGTTDINVNYTYCGGVDYEATGTFNGLGEPTTLGLLPNGIHGVAIMSAAQRITLGQADQVGRLNCTGHLQGAGVYISGNGTREITLLNNLLGSGTGGEPGWGNRYGVWVTAGARAVNIGLPGSPISEFGPNDISHVSYNVIQGNTEAGILLESGGVIEGTTTPDQPPPIPVDAIVVHNNYIGRPFVINNFFHRTPNKVGILLRAGAQCNRIGGKGPSEKNFIEYNTRAGIEIDGLVATLPVLSNRIIGNDINYNGNDDEPITGPLTGLATGAGLLISNGARGHLIGDLAKGGGNTFSRNHIGVLVDGVGGPADKHVIANNVFSLNRTAGILVRNAQGVKIGPNDLFGNGREILGVSAPIPLGGIALGGGGGHTVTGNTIGSQAAVQETIAHENVPYGLAIYNSSNNQVGEIGMAGVNTIIQNRTFGVLIQGAQATGNRLQNNWIGVYDGPAFRQAPNRGGGVLLRNGASGNLIGGTQAQLIFGALIPLLAGNTIRTNLGDGVAVDGAATLHNTISVNSISGHIGFLGINNLNGGNIELEPPVITEATGGVVRGTVNAATVPNGSRVEIFTDLAGEGRNYITHAIVNNGHFSANPGLLPLKNCTATVTDLQGNTSEFGLPVMIPPPTNAGLTLDRNAGAPRETTAPLNREFNLLPIRVHSVNIDARIVELFFTAEGSIDEHVGLQGISVYEDFDGDGVLSPSDAAITGLVPVSTNNGVTSAALNLPCLADETHFLILTGTPSAGAVKGQTIKFKINDNTFVDSSTLFPIAPIIETGTYPIVSDTVTLGGSIFTASQIAQYLISGVGMDPDMDVNHDGKIDAADVVTQVNAHEP